MKIRTAKSGKGPAGYLQNSLTYVVILAFIFSVFLVSDAQAFTLNVQGCDADNVCTPLTGGFRYLVEEDTTHPVTPGVPTPGTLGVSIHRSYAPVVTNGTSVSSTASVVVPNTMRYVVSVIPSWSSAPDGPDGYAIGGTNVAIGQSIVTVRLNKLPVPTAQISVYAFNDNHPINNAPDVPFEQGLGGFSVLVFDQAGQMSQDAFGNPLGTTYDAGGNVITMGTGVITTMTTGDLNNPLKNPYNLKVGEAMIKYLAPGKYGVRVVRPLGTNWSLTSTIEGTPGVDAWVKANEPNRLVEFGPGLWHTFYGFVQPTNLLGTLPNPGGVTGSITGQVVGQHTARPPSLQIYNADPIPDCWVGLNTPAGEGVYVKQCNADSTFTINAVPPGEYQIVLWDTPLDYVFTFYTVIVPGTGGTLNVGQLAMPRWFGTFKGSVFLDTNQNGVRDGGETGLAQQNINIRFRDGSIYQAQLTKADGSYEFEEVFPLFKWYVTEVDFARFKPTGMTAVVDNGGPLNNNLPPRTETGPILLEGMMLFADQTNKIDWGKVAYAPGENGGITGIIYYDTTRAENSPRFNAGEPWQPGIPRVQVCLYQDNLNATGATVPDGIIDDINGIPGIQLCDVDNYPFGWAEGTAPRGPEDVVRSGDGVTFSLGDAIEVASSDSWDDNLPAGCFGQTQYDVNGQPLVDCAETLKTWNQLVPAVFDGGYAFGFAAGGFTAPGTYIVEAIPPVGYDVVKEEDKNVVFGEAYRMNPLLVAPGCMGTATNTGITHTVPYELALFGGVPIDPPLAGSITPLCSMKQVTVAQGRNAAADFFFFTEVPKAARGVGLVTNDLAITAQNPNNPGFAEKTPTSWLPIAVYDFNGKEILRTYTDQWGVYNFLVPSTYTINPPIPTGVSPNMLRVCLNHPGPYTDPLTGQLTMDPFFNPKYSFTCYTLDFWPGKTTYLDTPLVPVSAFAELANATLDCEMSDGTPVISDVSGAGAVGPYVSVANGTQSVTITSPGSVQVPNPACAPFDSTCSPTITRNFGFGTTPGTVTVGGIPLTGVVWSDLSISGMVPAGMTTGQLVVTRGDNHKATVEGITLTVGGPAPIVVQAPQSIQAAIDAAAPEALIIVRPGSYNENVIIWKNVKLQGSAAYSTIINASSVTPEKIQLWTTRLDGLLAANLVSLVPGQDPALHIEESGILVIVKNDGSFASSTARIDGFSIMSANRGGGITVNGYAPDLQIANNRISNNAGSYGGGIRIGTPSLIDPSCTGYCSSSNTGIKIHHNHIAQNGAVGGAIGGGGIAIFNGSDNYEVSNNYICGNFAGDKGGGIAHFGLSTGGTIAGNKILFNESSFGTLTGGQGGGIMIMGEPDLIAGGLTQGTGSVTVAANLIQGNLAGSGNGGGILASFVNGQDAAGLPYSLAIKNNMIVNNVAGLSGAGIFLEDTVNCSIVNNTIANNDSTATGIDAFLGGAALQSTPQAAGVVARAHSSALATAIGNGFSNPLLRNNIIYSNRSFYWQPTLNGGIGGLLPNAAKPSWDLQVIGTAAPQLLNPQYCLLTNTTGYAGTNIQSNPAFVAGYLNTLQTAASPQEGGNFISVTFQPTTPTGDYHITAASPAVNRGSGTGAPTTDYDGEARPSGIAPEIGADEVVGAVGSLFTGSVVINGGAVATSSRSVTLTLSAASNAGAVTSRRVSWNNGTTWSGWTTYTATVGATVPNGDGIKTVSVQYRDAVGNISPTYTDTIILDRVRPTGSVVINGGAATTASTSVTLTFSATDAATSVTDMRWRWSNAAWGPWVAYAATANATITGGFGNKTVQVQYRDAAGNASSTYNDAISYQP